MQVCLASHDIAPFAGGGIAMYTTTLARVLSSVAEVTVITIDAGARAEPASASGIELPPGVRLHVVPAPDEHLLPYTFGYHQAWSAALLEAIDQQYEGAGPDLLEVPDYHAEGFVAVQARRSRHRALEHTRIGVRAHTSWEMCALLDGSVPLSRDLRALCAMERYVLRHADRLLWAGGDIHGAYERFYGRDCLAPGVRVRHPLPAAEPGGPRDGDGPLSFVYVGRLERRKGVLDLVRGFMRQADDDWRLTLVGGDTDTGPGGVSMQATLELMAMGDERIAFTGALPRSETLAAVRAHDVVVMPSRWECWPYSVLEAMQADRPVLATSVGGHVELVADGATGWLTPTGAEALGGALADLLRRPDEVRGLARGGAPSARAAALTDEDAIRAAYTDLARTPSRARRARRSRPLVSVIVPYRGMADFVSDAVASIDAQTHPSIEIVVVDDGSLHAADRVLDTLASRHPLRVLRQPNRGLGGARNAGIAQSGGRYVFPLDADSMAEPPFIERCVALLEDDPALAYVTSWSRFVDAEGGDRLGDGAVGYQPLGNFHALVEEHNIAGDAAAIWPRRLFGRGFRYSETVPVIEDWMLYRKLWRAGLYGQVIPEPLLRYRSRPGSMLDADAAKLDELRAQATAELCVEEHQWTPLHV